MGQYILRRLLAAIPVLAVVAVTAFFITNITPGDPVRLILGDFATEGEVQQMRASLGLDQPLPVRFGYWLRRVVVGDLGNSLFLQVPVTQALRQRLEPTIFLAVIGQFFGLLLGVPLGTLAAMHHRKLIDMGAIGISLAGISIPSFLVATLLVSLFGVRLGWLPVAGYQPWSQVGFGVWRYLFLPGLTLVFMQTALLARMTRSAVLEVLHQDFVRTARSKGVPQVWVMVKHVLRNAAIPIVTVFGLSFAALLGGTWIVESVFAVPGTGSLAVTAILRRDYPVIQGTILFAAGIYVAINLLVDLSYALFDPRLREK